MLIITLLKSIKEKESEREGVIETVEKTHSYNYIDNIIIYYNICSHAKITIIVIGAGSCNACNNRIIISILFCMVIK